MVYILSWLMLASVLAHIYMFKTVRTDSERGEDEMTTNEIVTSIVCAILAVATFVAWVNWYTGGSQ